MSRILVLLPVALWFLWADAHVGDPSPVSAGRRWADPTALALFVGGLALAVAFLAYAAVRAARREARGRSARQRLFRVTHALMLPATIGWFAFALFQLGWGDAVRELTSRPPLQLLSAPGAVLATLPMYATWALMLAAEYPVVRQRRESRLLVDLEDGRPIFAPPPAWRYWALAVRQRLLFALVPLLALMLVRDAAMLGLSAAGVGRTPAVEAAVFGLSTLAVIAASPELIRRLLPTRPLAPGPLRDRLERVGRRTGLHMRDVLVWDTEQTMVNAAVVGFLPRMRYVLLSDALLEVMSPAQVEAVFAHEVGHVRHRHVLWYFVFLVGMTLFLGGPVEAVWRWLVAAQGFESLAGTAAEYAVGFASLGLVLAGFGLLSRLFERQADVFAARTMQALATSPADGSTALARRTPVGAEGAILFGSSLDRAARMNHVPLAPVRPGRGAAGFVAWAAEELTHFLHGTIRSRMAYLVELAHHPDRTRRFDRTVAAVKFGVLALTLGSGAFVALTL